VQGQLLVAGNFLADHTPWLAVGALCFLALGILLTPIAPLNVFSSTMDAIGILIAAGLVSGRSVRSKRPLVSAVLATALVVAAICLFIPSRPTGTLITVAVVIGAVFLLYHRYI